LLFFSFFKSKLHVYCKSDISQRVWVIQNALWDDLALLQMSLFTFSSTVVEHLVSQTAHGLENSVVWCQPGPVLREPHCGDVMWIKFFWQSWRNIQMSQ